MLTEAFWLALVGTTARDGRAVVLVSKLFQLQPLTETQPYCLGVMWA